MAALANIRVGFALGMTIACCLFCFHLHWLPNANNVYGGIWALEFLIFAGLTCSGEYLSFCTFYHMCTYLLQLYIRT